MPNHPKLLLLKLLSPSIENGSLSYTETVVEENHTEDKLQMGVLSDLNDLLVGQ
jgi:hypothetical protein